MKQERYDNIRDELKQLYEPDFIQSVLDSMQSATGV